MGGNFKFQAQDSFLEYVFWGGDLKNESHFLKKGTFKTVNLELFLICLESCGEPTKFGPSRN